MDAPILKQLKLAIGYDCNLKCGFCLQQLKDKSPMLDFDHVEKVMNEEMVRENVDRIIITGGEPLYLPYINTTLKIVELAHSQGKETCIFTNGTLIDYRTLADFKSAGLTRFRISIYDPVDWEEIKKLMEVLKLYGFPQMVKYTVTRESYLNKRLDMVLENVPKAGIEWFQIKPYNRVEVEEIDNEYEMEPHQVLMMAKTLIQFKKNNPEIRTDLLPLCYEFLVDDTISSEELSPCNCGKGPTGYLVVTPNGDVKICGAYPISLGNISLDKVTDIWYNHPLLKIVREKAEKPKPEECEGCGYWDKCSRTDCQSATFAKYGNFKHGNPQCPLVKSAVAVK